MEVYASLGTCGKHTCTHWGVQKFGDSDISKALPHILTITVLQEDGDVTVSKEMIPKNLYCNYSNEGPIQQPLIRPDWHLYRQRETQQPTDSLKVQQGIHFQFHSSILSMM